MSEWLANNWEDHPAICRAVVWRSGNGSAEEVFSASVEGKRWTIRMNDFPEEPLYTLLIDGRTILHFNDWPNWSNAWGEKPALP